MSLKPKTIVYLRPDTIGDLVLFAPALGLFMSEWPQARHVVVVRRSYESLKSLFPAGLEWKVTDLNPFKQRPAECRELLSDLMADLEGIGPDLILAPTLNRTWLEISVAAHFRGVRSVVLGSAEVDPIFAASLRLDLGVDPAAAFAETIASVPDVTDVENQHRFAETLVGHKLGRVLPSVQVTADMASKARAIADGLGVARGAWTAVFPGGLANVPVKAWTPAGFAEVVAWLEKKKLPVLLLAHESERKAVQAVADSAKALGIRAPKIWLGKDGEIPLLAALLADAKAYVGHDTGAMHLAGAVGRPVVGIFGGGHWPRFRPSARQAISVVQPLPCFGCNWDCHFGDGPCVKTLTGADVIGALEKMLAAGDTAIDAVVESHALSAQAVAFIAAATPGIIALKRDRVDRQHKIEELKDETDSKDVEIEDLKRAAEERKTEMESIKAELEEECANKDTEIAELKTETNSKDTEIDELKRAAEDRKTEMESIKAELEEECTNKDTEIAELKAETNTKDTEIEELKETCNEREATVIRLDGGLKAHIAAAGAREARIAALEAENATMAARLKTLADLPADATFLAQEVKYKDTHIANLEGIARSREDEIRTLKEAVANFKGGYGGTELAKHYGHLLSEKEAVIQELSRACKEREAVINELAAGGAAPASGMRKLWIGLAFNVREKLWRPFQSWAFRKVVEDYWMKIGVLRQYEPRPISWDRRLAVKPAPESTLPSIGIVTPSYGQPAFLESTMVSILDQAYPKLLYVVQDGGSKDSSPDIIAKHASRLRHWASEPDKGQADAVRKGFAQIEPELGPTDVMGYINSDDLLAPRALNFVGSYFASHPDVDVVYGHRIIIDDADKEIGRWIMPRHEPDSIEWIDYVPQETLFWRKRAWDTAGGIDTSFQFALDWDLLARFHQAGCRVVRLPYFLACFRVHAQQKTSSVIHTTGAEEMARIRLRFHGVEKDNTAFIEKHAQRIRFRGALTARLHAAGVRF